MDDLESKTFRMIDRFLYDESSAVSIVDGNYSKSVRASNKIVS